jgi:hypothetical protein
MAQIGQYLSAKRIEERIKNAVLTSSWPTADVPGFKQLTIKN